MSRVADRRQKINRHLRKRGLANQFINTDDLSPGIAAGLTQGPETEPLKVERFEDGSTVQSLRGERGAHAPSGLEAAQHLNEKQKTPRSPRPHFVGQDALESPLVREMADGRRFADVNLTFDQETLRAIQAGMICMKCLEPQETSFGDRHITVGSQVVCEGVMTRGPHYMRDWQIIEFAMEFEGNTHIGPSRPISEHLDELDAKTEKRRFDKAIAEGRSPMKGLSYAT